MYFNFKTQPGDITKIFRLNESPQLITIFTEIPTTSMAVFAISVLTFATNKTQSFGTYVHRNTVDQHLALSYGYIDNTS